ncbi:carboxymuconolactone decarboxylase family protein [Mycobacterium lacus]|uniref:Carboxymuconolactone decarboxylase n=1 Tax=Mycobacterium lacus TaxID=169765 RepID=A0A1X1YVR3_9MYCO|nr:carboxymuconolactone decarboxylase family protein [Mycobacterium lacus]MCV7121706.1 carboxymuconolactone decarboxylase family protein [Mycobacterium lacus]ORW15134.1 carboxymuconolactone decarboxylase [Mycobacterium lacus]BBX94984.1 carboxymuconolactone decarboxylase [Mycobacterium lacus]
MRLQPLPADQWDEAVRRSLADMLPPERRNPRDAGNALATFARHPALAKAFLGFNIHLLFGSTLPPRVRELAILRIAHRRDCTYEWTHHVALATKAGIADDEIAAVRRGEAADEFERAVLAGVDELDEKSRLSAESWAALGERLDDRQRMDYVFTVGCYALLAMAFNTFGVEVER